MERFLRELDKVLASLDGPERERAVQGLRQLIVALPALRFLNGVSKAAGAAMVGSVSIAMAGGRSFDEWFTKVKKAAAAKAPNVDALFRSI